MSVYMMSFWIKQEHVLKDAQLEILSKRALNKAHREEVIQVGWNPQNETILASCCLGRRLMVWDLSRNDTNKHGLIVASKDEVAMEHNMPKAMTSGIHLSNTWLAYDMLQGLADSSKKLQPTLSSHFDPCSFSPTKISQSFNHLANGNDMSHNKRFKITYIITGKVHYGDNDEEEEAELEEFYDYNSRSDDMISTKAIGSREYLRYHKISSWDSVVLTYEPVWATGTGKVASLKQAEEVS
ncbi:WD40 repeat-containing protein MSI1 [Tanacetum coccineum]|uniref:WD40 repeat-containing protein MSI1 n=1 Tax=Tanacetum coccineum TaxID=301880 RepID=A0ABQ5DX87_9ASTR